MFLLAASMALGGGAASPAGAVELVSQVQFKPLSIAAKIALPSGIGTLSTSVGPTLVTMTLVNVNMGGGSETTELRTKIARSTLALDSSIVVDLISGQRIQAMERKRETSMLDGKPADVFVYREFKNKAETRTEPYIEYKVADFLSVILLAADAIEKKHTQPIDLSMLRERSVTRVQLTVEGPENLGKTPATRVRVTAPDNPKGGIVYVIGQTADGRYYPARIRAEIKGVTVEIEGVPEK